MSELGKKDSDYYDKYMNEAVEQRNAPENVIRLTNRRNDAILSSVTSLSAALFLGIFCLLSLGIAWGIALIVVFGAVAINEGVAAGIYQKKVKKLFDKYPELKNMDNEALKKECQKRYSMFEIWSKSADKATISFKEYYKNNSKIEVRASDIKERTDFVFSVDTSKENNKVNVQKTKKSKTKSETKDNEEEMEFKK